MELPAASLLHSPLQLLCRNRRRHLPTVAGVVPTLAAAAKSPLLPSLAGMICAAKPAPGPSPYGATIVATPIARPAAVLEPSAYGVSESPVSPLTRHYHPLVDLFSRSKTLDMEH